MILHCRTVVLPDTPVSGNIKTIWVLIWLSKCDDFPELSGIDCNLSFSGRSHEQSRNVRIVWQQSKYQNGQNGTTVHHYAWNCNGSLGFYFVVNRSVQLRTGLYCWCSTTTSVRNWKEQKSCLRHALGLPPAASRRQGSDVRKRSYSWWYCSLVQVFLWSVDTRTHTQPSFGKIGM